VRTTPPISKDSSVLQRDADLAKYATEFQRAATLKSLREHLRKLQSTAKKMEILSSAVSYLKDEEIEPIYNKFKSAFSQELRELTFETNSLLFTPDTQKQSTSTSWTWLPSGTGSQTSTSFGAKREREKQEQFLNSLKKRKSMFTQESHGSTDTQDNPWSSSTTSADQSLNFPTCSNCWTGTPCECLSKEDMQTGFLNTFL